MLVDEGWARVAVDIMHRTGLGPYGQDDDAVRWVAVRHIHLVAMLARQDGRRPNLWHDYYRVREACQAAEHRYGLRRTAPADRTRPAAPAAAKARRPAANAGPSPPAPPSAAPYLPQPPRQCTRAT